MMKKILIIVISLFSVFSFAIYSDSNNELKDLDSFALKRLVHVNEIIKNGKDKPTIDQLNEVNNYFNMFKYVSDKTLWGLDDYWSNLKEFIKTGAGDCEDYAIAKYETLVKMGVDKRKFRFFYGVYLPTRTAHLLLGYYENNKSAPLYLDNNSDHIEISSLYSVFIPLYSFNDKNIFIYDSETQHESSFQSNILTSWKNEKKGKKINPKLNLYF